MSHLGSRVAFLRFRNTEIIPKQSLQKVCQQDEFWFTEGFGAFWVYRSWSRVWRRPLEAGRKAKNVQKIAWILDCRKPEKVPFSDVTHLLFQGNTADLLGSGILNNYVLPIAMS